MKDYYQITAAGFGFRSILECNIHKAVGEHGRAYLKGQILEPDIEKYMQYGSGYTWSSIQITDESGTKTVSILVTNCNFTRVELGCLMKADTILFLGYTQSAYHHYIFLLLF